MRESIDPDFDANLPLDDYYFSPKKLEMMKVVQQGNLNICVPRDRWSQLQQQLAARVPLGARELVPLISSLEGETYYELFRNGLKLIERAFDAYESKWCGFNDNWIIEYFPLLAKSFQGSRFIVIVRDPRGAMASSMKLREKEPELVPLMYSFAHHWRKHAAFSRMLIRHPLMAGRLFVIRYEDLVTESERYVREVCRFLEVAYDEAMLDTERFRPFRGDKWSPWSNFKVPEKGIYSDSITQWKRYLTKGAIEFIEFICAPEMKLFGYAPEIYGGGLPSTEVMRFLLEDDKMAQGWRGVHGPWDEEHAYELFRKQALRVDKSLLSTETIEKNFLFESVYDELVPLEA
jgi:hypothetical protein